MKLNKIRDVILMSMTVFLVGCGGGGSSNKDNSSSTQDVSIKASDAYVVALPTPATLKIGEHNYTTKAVNNGTITFTIPSNIKLNDVEFYVPGDAMVDIDGDGKLSDKDQVIRMPLETRDINSIANPIATAALAQNDNKTYELVKNFDPVKAKTQLIAHPDDNKTKVLVLVSDTIALLANDAKNNKKNSDKIIKNVNINIIKQIKSNPKITTETNDTDIAQEMTESVDNSSVDITKITQKVKNVMDTIKEAGEVVKIAKTKNKSAEEIKKLENNLTVSVLSVSDGNVSSNTAINNIKKLKNQINSALIYPPMPPQI